MKTLLAVIAALCLPACAQTPVARMPNAVKVCSEGCTITTMPAGTVYQFGSGATWIPSATSTATVPKLPFYVYYTAFAFDPIPGTLKELDVQQQANAFTVTYSLNGGSVTVTIPALTPTPAPTNPPTYKFSCTFPAQSPMPAKVTLTCGQAVKQ